MKILTIGALFFLAGCETQETEDPFSDISQQIEQIKSEAQAGSSTGTTRNIRVDVQLLTTNLEEYTAVEVLWQYVDPSFSAGTGPSILEQSGLRIGVASEGFEVQFNAARRRMKFSEQTRLFLLLADGASGYITIGEEIAVPGFYYMNQWYNGVYYNFRRAVRSLEVTARQLPDGQIELILTPVFSRFLSSGGDLALTELSTTVTVQPGQVVVLGGDTQTSNSAATALLGRRTNIDKTQTLITVTANLR